jgi:hypothetical protein
LRDLLLQYAACCPGNLPISCLHLVRWSVPARRHLT